MRKTAVVAALVLLASAASAADWPQWRGPARDGRASLAPRATWPEALTPAWTITVGEGHASPVVVGDRVYVFSREGEEEVVQALDLATGKRVWRASYPAPYTMNSAATGHGKGPKSTPTVAGGRVFTFGISGILSAFDAATGRLAWRKDTGTEFGQGSPLYGVALSPVVDGSNVIVHVGGPGKGALTAFDAGDRCRPLGLEGRRAGLRLAGGGHDRRRAAGRDLQRVVPRRGRGRPRRAPLEDPLHDRVGAERGDAGRGRRPRRLLRPRPPGPCDPGRARRDRLDDRAALGEPGRRRLHEHAGARGRAALRPLPPQEGPAVLPRRGHGKDGLDLGRAAGRQRGARRRGRSGVRARPPRRTSSSCRRRATRSPRPADTVSPRAPPGPTPS